jgi:endothelin-converting enzyme
MEGDAESPNYGDLGYWERRYGTHPDAFDWYFSWDFLLPILRPVFTGDEKVLVIGCGNSSMSFQMAQTTFQSVTSIDFSPTVIAQMRTLYAPTKTLTWEVMDCKSMTFPNESFDIAFDKGTIDSIICGPHPIASVHATLTEVERVLAPAGLFIVISLGSPDTRLSLFRRPKLPWHLHDTLYVQDPDQPASMHYIYIFQKMSSTLSRQVLVAAAEEEDEEEEEEEEEEAGA